MKAISFLRTISIVTVAVLSLAAISFGQSVIAKDNNPKGASTVRAIPLPAPSSAADAKTNESVDKSLEDEILPYYDNYLREYRLGPSDVITVEVFGQCPEYCRPAVIVPPTARISYPLIRDGVLVAGRTVEQVAAEITKKLDEFIIDPKVTVTLEKAMATRYSVMGNVAAPGVRVMSKKMSVYEAILDAGGPTKNANQDKVYVVSYAKGGRLERKQVSLSQMEKGKADMVYLNPGDQVFVSGKGFTIDKFFELIAKASSVAFLFGNPF